MHHDGSAATAMLGLTGFVLLAVSDHDGELEYAVETSEWMTGCRTAGCWPGCMIAAAPTYGIYRPVAGR